MTNANQWLEQWYPRNGTCVLDDLYKNKGKKRNEIIKLNVTKQNLRGTLNLTDFTNLEELYCPDNKITTLILKDNSNLRIISCWKNQLTNLVLPQSDKLRILGCSNNQLTNLDLSNCFNLQALSCFNNKLNQLTLSNSESLNYTNSNLTNLNLLATNQLEEIVINNNFLTNFNYNSLNPATLKELSLHNNNLIATDLDVFSSFINLTRLNIGNDGVWIQKNKGNQFTGSFASLQNLTKLERLDIQNLKLETDFQYLSANLKHVECSGQTKEELMLYGHNLQLWQAHHPHLMKEAKNELVKLTDFKLQFKKQIRTPFSGIFKSAGTTNYHQQFQYHSFLLKDSHPFSWEYNNTPEIKNLWENKVVEKRRLTEVKNLPLRLYNLATEQVIITENNSNINNYLILSYCWGTEWENTPQSYGQAYSTDLTKLGRKALNKVQAAYQLLKQQSSNFPDYIWIDNFCINQNNKNEKGNEVRNQRSYYSNATVTLIAIDEDLEYLRFFRKFINELELTKEIIIKIITSPWFHRAWTFQEGLLSKQTIFMFDDTLVDGRRLALYWGGRLSSYNQPSTFITPLGWSYHNQTRQTIELTLGEALEAISHREQTVLLDSIYSILGLLPYGNKFTVHYQETNNYTNKDLENKLVELINQAYLYDSKEIITYMGERNLNNWWLPMINENCSFNISDSLNSDDGKYQHFISQIQQVTKQGIQLKGYYTLIGDTKIVELDSASWIETLQFTLNQKKQLISIKEVVEQHHSDNQFRNPQELFIDMLNYEVILKEEQPEKYHKLVYQPLINYTKDQFELGQAGIKPFLILTKLDLAQLNLTESLDLSELVNLEELRCFNNQITELMLPLDNKLKVIESSDCYLTSFNYSSLNPTTLTRLDISNNNLLITNIATFSHLINLELLWIGNSDKERIKRNIYNCFYGSLASWKVLTKLKRIEISNTNINAGVEYLPYSIRRIQYSTKERPDCRLKKIEQKITKWLERKQSINETKQLISYVKEV